MGTEPPMSLEMVVQLVPQAQPRAGVRQEVTAAAMALSVLLQVLTLPPPLDTSGAAQGLQLGPAPWGPWVGMPLRAARPGGA